MMVFINGIIVPEEAAKVSVFDRGFLYGDGLFETLRIARGHPFLWQEHMERLARGAGFLKLPLPYSAERMEQAARELSARNNMPEAVLRLTLTRGVGRRGYSPQGAATPCVVMTLHPVPTANPSGPVQWRMVTSSIRLEAGSPLAAFKTCNKLPQVLARTEADTAGADEALMLNTDGHAVEGAAGNLFWVRGEQVHTPPLDSGILAGVTRALVTKLCPSKGKHVCETRILPEALRQADGVFFTLSSLGIAEAISLDGKPLAQSPVTKQIWRQYLSVLDEDTSARHLDDRTSPRL